MQHISHGRILAMVAGMAFTVGGLVILMGDVLMHPELWTQYHALTILTVFGTIAAGHLMATAGKAKHFFAALGFGLLFLAGTGLVVANSLGRQAEVSDAKAFDAEATNTALAAKHGELAKARERFDDANKYADKEMTGERCGPRCKDWRLRATEVGAHIKALEGEIAALGPVKPVNAKADKIAAIAALFGASADKAKAAFMLLEPFLWCLFFEIGSIVSLGFAFRSGPVALNDNRPVLEVEPLPPARMIEPDVKGGNIIDWSKSFERLHGRKPRLDETKAAFPQVSRSTCYRRLKAA
jgi:hypothetical protein